MGDINPILYGTDLNDTFDNLTMQNIINTNLALESDDLRIDQYLNNGYWISINEVRLLEKMNLVWQEHIMWTRLLLISIAENLKDLEATQTRLLKNPKDIADVFRPYYGNEIANEIEKLLTEHLVIGKDLIVALKNNNQEQVNLLNKKWYQNADSMAEAFSSINPFYSKEEIRSMLYEHLRLTTIEVTARLKGDYVTDINAYDMVQNEILKMSNFFVNGIVKQFPDSF